MQKSRIFAFRFPFDECELQKPWSVIEKTRVYEAHFSVGISESNYGVNVASQRKSVYRRDALLSFIQVNWRDSFK